MHPSEKVKAAVARQSGDAGDAPRVAPTGIGQMAATLLGDMRSLRLSNESAVARNARDHERFDHELGNLGVCAAQFVSHRQCQAEAWRLNAEDHMAHEEALARCQELCNAASARAWLALAVAACSALLVAVVVSLVTR